MGCFSFICKECGKPVNSTSFNGENVRLSLLDKGKIVEEMQGEYDSYGRVFDENHDSMEWKKRWDEVCDLMFATSKSSGMAAAHVHCIKKNPAYNPETRSEDDPDQGWGRLKTYHCGECETYHKIM